MKLKEFSNLVAFDRGRFGEIAISGITADSRTLNRGDLFAALKGVVGDGADFTVEAVQHGAAAVLTSMNSKLPLLDVPILRADDPRWALAKVAARFYGEQPQTVVAVTGTSGKTSVAVFLRQIWEESGLAAASIGTTGVVAPGYADESSLTTPDPVHLHELLHELAVRGVHNVAMEASSHGLDQRRLDGVELAAAGFTNLGRDHLDYHKSVADYHQAKMRLFVELLPKGAPAVIYADDPWSEKTAAEASAAGCEVHLVGRKGTSLQLLRLEHERHRQRAHIRILGHMYEVNLPLAGDFQLANAMVAAGLAIVTGTGTDDVLHALAHLKGAPGRLDLVGTSPSGAPVYVDYAHKPEALENVLNAVRPFTTGRIVLLFGCGGDRDRGKRAIMGEIADRLADITIITDDNPRSEDPAEIRAQIRSGIPQALEIGDRREAIQQAIAMLADGDTLVVAGKGHERGQTIGSTTYKFSDHDEVCRVLGKLAS